MKCTVNYPSFSTLEATQRLATLDYFEGVWANAADEYAAEFMGKRSVGGKTPRGMQKHVNAAIQKRLYELGWEGVDGRYHKGDEWLRVSFRHSMSLGSDLLDAARMHFVEGFKKITLIGASESFLATISPADCKALCSADDYRAQAKLNEFALEIPFGIGTLEPVSVLEPSVTEIIRGNR
jgi:hypothetical protein